ncbi:biotin--[acetyl-CoA-carboxylase] ligase [Oceanobacillus piezotolerans]|uniref:Bifunctional ligase/repressor BirA n=1 Tax=Oceanobacillus piezotolerans TaxID=2448030 RepID=A0A498DTN6_9BACI|nr:biotin--[acetyl-CoA-carboxylase] ligase [Oceanobacillus piezotolerans]RLL48227.1 biotin--[acetyl-CoA-carboxylase] ligase [Oceanobacillus piezotolerans]
MQSTRNKLIDILSNNSDTYISGQAISEQLQISRSAIWKHMKELEKDGYVIEGKSKRGYRILEYPNKLSGNTIKWGLETEWLGKEIIYKDTLKSTQILAHELAQGHAQHGTVVVAGEQTQGRGRMDHTWESSKEKGIWMSFILRPEIAPNQAPQLTLLAATVLAEVLRRDVGVVPMIKWPNDLLINRKKCAGILTEMQAEQDQIWYVVLGMGINVNHTLDDFPKDLHSRATSLKLETDKTWEIRDLIQKILVTFERTYNTYLDNGFSVIKERWEKDGFRIGEQIKIKTLRDKWEAPFLGIAEDGALQTKTPNGEETKLYSAEIDWFS